MLDLNATTVTVLDANGKPAPGAAFPIPRSLGVRTVYRWTHDAQGGYLIIVTVSPLGSSTGGAPRPPPFAWLVP